MEDEEYYGWDGPRIRPPQVKHDSRDKPRYNSDRHVYHKSSSAGSSSSHHRDGREHERSSSRDKSRGSHYDRDSSHKHQQPPKRGVEDLRNRIGHSKLSTVESRHSTKTSSESERHSKNRNQQPQTSSSLSDAEMRLRKFMSAAKSTEKRDTSRRDAEVRRQRREIERQMQDEEERVKRKRERSRSRTDEERGSRGKKHQKKEQIVVPSPPQIQLEISSDDEIEKKEQSEGSGSSSEDEESGEVETSSDSSDDDDDDDDTGSEQSGDTPDHDDEKEDVKEAETAPKHKEVEKSKSSGKDRKVEKKDSPDSSISLTSSDEEDRQESRTPSKSPTPRRTVEKEETSETTRFTRKEGSPSSSSADDLPEENEQKEEDETEDPEDKLPPYLPSVYGCRSVEEFTCLNRIEEGTYGVVYRAKDKKTNQIVALKRLKMEREKEGFPITSLREINTLLISQHENVVTVREIVVGSNMDKIYIVMDFVEHDLKSLMETMREKKQVFLPGEVKCLMEQLLNAIGYLHDNWILHRDLKTSNLLLSHNGILKVGDFGLAREYGSPLKPYTSVVVTLWYRAPELLLGIKEYSTHIDVWSVGCIFAELLLMEPLFTGKTDQDQLTIIFKLLGTPNEKIWTGFTKLPVVQKAALPEYPPSNLRTKFHAQMLSDFGLALLKKLFTYDPKKRITCDAALNAEYFDESPRAIDPSMFPTWPAKSEQSAGGHQAKKGASPKPPSGGGAYKNINAGDDEYGKYTGFVLNPGKAPAPAPWNLKF